MELSLFDDFPLRLVSNGLLPHTRRSRPILRRLLNSMEDDLDQKVGYLYRRLPGVVQDLMDEFDKRDKTTKKRKSENALAEYEPKSKVQVTNKDNKFQVTLDTSYYQPDEIQVKVVKDLLTISAKHESKKDDCYEFHEMHRSFNIPEGVDPDTITSKLSLSGQLIVEAPLKALKESSNERTVPILKSSDQTAVEDSEEASSKDKVDK